MPQNTPNPPSNTLIRGYICKDKLPDPVHLIEANE
ncbi:hypothetical protein TcasGA2_TC034545 [Tribolium castaneum]|uniref:Uncharacterized protein n=1 Tax=Tribolium castaneum TaxID=7070 RepID=A0A139WN97_TRICA|nr:hypothetical protein TcasGA2_TC034545 [Tribolium castaneum]